MKILVACGGTGGHIFPALSFVDMLQAKSKDSDILLVVTKRRIESQIIPQEYKTAYISISPIKLKLDKDNIISILRLFKGALESMVIIFKFNPDAVVGFGGYASFFLVFFAWALGIKTVIHEQNVEMGLANRILAHFADRIAISFYETKNYLKGYRNKIIITGNLLRIQLEHMDKERALNFFGFSKDRFTILIMGGSLGAHRINTEFLKAMSTIKDNLNPQIIHLSGEFDYDFLSDSYRSINVPARLFKFLDRMQYAYSAADLIICRAGALTISEVIYYKIPAIIIPYPYAHRHQTTNAKILTDKGCAILIQDASLEGIGLSKIIIELFINFDKINNMRSNYGSIKKDTQLSLYDVILTLN